MKDAIPSDHELRSRVVYKFICAGFNACYLGETSRHLPVRVREHFERDRTSHVSQHLKQSEQCRGHCSETCFKALDTAPTCTRYQLLQEAARIRWENPSLNKQLNHAELTLMF